MNEQLKREWLKRRDERHYTKEQIMLWWSGVSTAWRLLKGEPPPMPDIPDRVYQSAPGRTPCSNHKGFKEDCGCP